LGRKPLANKIYVTSQIIDLVGKVDGYPHPADGRIDTLKLGLLGVQMRGSLGSVQAPL
jgi:hypothetical protein